ncbi:hypothetical protein MLD38_011663 [Melastoma candidum]|uniref:Uncharacterized protein n=1 Tax=Melastoma candidum TaxID=119954 RepID=A0ACB9R540_9MYRT|nr:hypothetical protein MLD38_011663 [Melastoma candidum]
MAKLMSQNSWKKNVRRLPKLKNVVEKLQKGISLGRKLSTSSGSFSWESENRDYVEFDDCGYDAVPEDVKEGHFAVIALEDEEPKKIVIPITHLRNPRFLRLLEEAAEEYGFGHAGALPIPCRSSELENILFDC